MGETFPQHSESPRRICNIICICKLVKPVYNKSCTRQMKVVHVCTRYIRLPLSQAREARLQKWSAETILQSLVEFKLATITSRNGLNKQSKYLTFLT